MHTLSSQTTMFRTADMIFSKVSAVDSVDMTMPNFHHFMVDLSKIGIPNSGEASQRTGACVQDIATF